MVIVSNEGIEISFDFDLGIETKHKMRLQRLQAKQTMAQQHSRGCK
jgi:hypothetical protein